MTRVVLSLMVFLGSLTMATAADRAVLYEPATLQYWGERYQRSTTKILTDIIWPALLSEEKRRFGRQPVLDFPLYAEGKARQHPLAFYVPADLSRVVMPVFSLKFLLMKPLWGEADEGFGDVAMFEEWVQAGGRGPLPAQMEGALALYHYGEKEGASP